MGLSKTLNTTIKHYLHGNAFIFADPLSKLECQILLIASVQSSFVPIAKFIFLTLNAHSSNRAPLLNFWQIVPRWNATSINHCMFGYTTRESSWFSLFDNLFCLHEWLSPSWRRLRRICLQTLLIAQILIALGYDALFNEVECKITKKLHVTFGSNLSKPF